MSARGNWRGSDARKLRAAWPRPAAEKLVRVVVCVVCVTVVEASKGGLGRENMRE